MKRYSIAQLEAFIWICKLGTFRAAADHLSVTQPTISLRISELETALGISLFEKSGRGVTLSAEGALVRRYVEHGIGLLDQMDGMLHLEQPFDGLLRLGSIDALAMTCLPEVVGMLEASYPDLRVNLTIATSTDLVDLLDQKNLDIAFLGEPARKESCWFELIGSLETAWVGGVGKFDQKATIAPEDLYRERVLTLQSPSRLHQIIDDWFANEKAPSPTLSVCNDISLITRFVAKGLAVSVLPVCVVRQELESGLIESYVPTLPLPALPLYVAGQPPARDARVVEAVRKMSDVIAAAGILA